MAAQRSPDDLSADGSNRDGKRPGRGVTGIDLLPRGHESVYHHGCTARPVLGSLESVALSRSTGLVGRRLGACHVRTVFSTSDAAAPRELHLLFPADIAGGGRRRCPTRTPIRPPATGAMGLSRWCGAGIRRLFPVPCDGLSSDVVSSKPDRSD